MKLFSSLFVIILFTLLNFSLSAQNNLARELNIRKTLSAVTDRNVVLSSPDQFELNTLGIKKEGNSIFFRIDAAVVNDIIETQPDLLRFKVPYGADGGQFEVVLFNKKPFKIDAIVRTNEGKTYQMTKGAYYRGMVEGEDKSLVALSFIDGEMSGVISSTANGQYDIGSTKISGIHVSYDANTLPYKNNFKCGTDEGGVSMIDGIEDQIETRDAGDCVKIFMEASYKIFQNKGSVANVENYINGFFNVVATLYNNENVTVEISEIFVWTTQDPFPTNGSSDALEFYDSYRTNFNGDIAHLLAKTNNGNGGIAYINALCNNNYKYSYADINMTYSNFPTYSWTVEVVTHELGHNIGSAHTQSCSWPVGALDNCYETEGSCGPGPAPVNGGTIMSYCHLTNYGINFANGFGQYPGDRIRERIISKHCLDGCGAQCPTFVLNGVLSPLTCSGINNGAIMLNSPTVGQAPFTYAWSNGANTQNIINLAPGAYSVTVTDVAGCPGYQTFVVSGPPELISTSNQTDATCFGANNGIISLNTNGGTPQYSYIWSNGMISSTVANLAPGPYSVTISDANNCTLNKNFFVQQPTPLIINESIGNISCFAENDGLISVSGNGGTGGIFYLWNTGSTISIITNLGSGTYSVTITDANLCETTESYTLIEPSPITAAVTVIDASNGSTADGAAEAFVSGGTPVYSYIWSNGATSKIVTNLAVGSYSVTITDAHNCQNIQYFSVDAPDCQLSTNLVGVPVSCAGDNNGSAAANVSNPLGSVTYKWSNGGQTQTIGGLSSGNYTVTITDNSCSIIKTVNIGSPAPIIVNSSYVSPTCNNSNGSISINVNGGSAPFTYAWSNGATSANINNIAAGQYIVTVTDQNLCNAIYFQNIVAIDNLAPVITNTNVTIYLDENGQANLNGFSPDYFFNDNCGLSSINFQNGIYNCSHVDQNNSTLTTAIDASGNSGNGVINVIVIDTLNPVVICPSNIKQGICQGAPVWDDIDSHDNCTIQGITQVAGFPLGTIFPLGVTTNTFIIADNSGNTTECSFDVTITEGLSLQLIVKNMVCNNVTNGSAEVDVSNITPPYTINWSNGENTPKIINLDEGTYSVTVTDGSSCSFAELFVITNPLPIAMNVINILDASNAGSSDGAIEITVSGGNPEYTFEWTKNNVIVSTEKDPKGLSSGIYKVVIKDKNGCVLIGAEITVGISLSSNHWTLDPLSIFPNPANSYIYIRSKDLKDCVIKLYDVLGRKIEIPSTFDKNSQVLNINNLSNGTYLLRVEKNDQWFISKIIINH